MKIHQENNGFSPIAIVLETKEDAVVFWDMINRVKRTTDKDAEYEMALEISDWLSNAAQRRKEKEMAIGPNVVDDCEGMTEEDYWRGMDEAMQDEEGDEPFCTCSTGHGIEETDWNQCDSCGKPIYDEEPAVPPAPTFEKSKNG